MNYNIILGTACLVSEDIRALPVSHVLHKNNIQWTF